MAVVSKGSTKESTSNQIFRATRPLNLLIMALTLLLSLLLFSDTLSWQLLTHGSLLLIPVTLFIAAAGNLHNDIHDVEADRINRTSKLSTDNISRHSFIIARNIFGALGVIGGIVYGFYISSIPVILIILLSALILWIYSPWLKSQGLPGNILISLLPAFVVLLLPLAEMDTLSVLDASQFGKSVHHFFHIDTAIWFFALFACLANISREIIKDLEDIEGDRIAAYRTLATQKGRKAALLVISLFTLLLNAVIVSFAVYLYGTGLYFTALYIVLIAVWLLAWDFRNRKARQKEDYHQQSMRMKAIMALGMLGMLVLIIERQL